MKFLTIFLTLATSVLPSFQTDYCSPKICPKGKTHIACNNNGAIASSCAATARLIDIKPHIEHILDAHNKRRNIIAGGKLEGYKSAKRMATMRWDNELATLAELNVKQCVMKHDACRSTDNFRHPGQHLGKFGYNGANESIYSDEWLFHNRMEAWWLEYQDCNMKYIDKYPRNYEGPAIGHFTLMANEKNFAVGCAALRFRDGAFFRFLMTCNYALKNWYNNPSYVSGQTAADCKTGKNTKYEYLCSPSEKYFL